MQRRFRTKVNRALTWEAQLPRQTPLPASLVPQSKKCQTRIPRNLQVLQKRGLQPHEEAELMAKTAQRICPTTFHDLSDYHPIKKNVRAKSGEIGLSCTLCFPHLKLVLCRMRLLSQQRPPPTHCRYHWIDFLRGSHHEICAFAVSSTSQSLTILGEVESKHVAYFLPSVPVEHRRPKRI